MESARLLPDAVNAFLTNLGRALSIFTSHSRFQDIAGDMESALMKPFVEYDGDKSIKPVHLKSTAALWDALNACFTSDIYLPAIAHRFWKLCLQILARYRTKINGILQEVFLCFLII